MSDFNPMPKSKQLGLEQKPKKDKNTPFGKRKNKGNFGSKKPLKTTIKSTFNNHKKAIIKKRITTDKELKTLNLLNENKHLFRCFVCGGACEHLHHIKLYSSDKKDHSKLLPLCQFHHVGDELSPHGTPVKWRDRFTMEEQIVASRRMLNEIEGLYD